MSGMEKTLHFLNGLVDRSFTAFARAVRSFGVVIFAVGLAIAIAFSVGIITSETEKDADALWVDLDSRLVDEKKDFERYFGGLTRKLVAMTSTADGSPLFSTSGGAGRPTPQQVMEGHIAAMRVWEQQRVVFEGRNYIVHDFCERPLVPLVFQRNGSLAIAYQRLTKCLATDIDFSITYQGLVSSKRYPSLLPFSPLAEGWGIDSFPCARASVMDCFHEGREVDYNEALKKLEEVAGGVLIAAQTSFVALAAQLGATKVPELGGISLKELAEGYRACWMVKRQPSSTDCLIDENSTSPLVERNDTSIQARGMLIVQAVNTLQKALPQTLNTSTVTQKLQGLRQASASGSEEMLERAVQTIQTVILDAFSGNLSGSIPTVQTRGLEYYFKLQNRLANNSALGNQIVAESCIRSTSVKVTAYLTKAKEAQVQALVDTPQLAAAAPSGRQILGIFNGLSSRLLTTAQFFGTLGYWWRKSFKDMNESEILDHFTQCARTAADPVRIANPSAGLAECVTGVRRCCVTWNGAIIGNSIIMGGGKRGPAGVINITGRGDTYYPVYESIQTIRSGLEDYNQDNPLWRDILKMRYPETQWTDGDKREDLAEAFDEQLTDAWKKLYNREAGSGYESGGKYGDLRLDFSTGNSLKDVISDASKVPTGLLITSYVVMIVYVMLSLGGYVQAAMAMIRGDRSRAAEAMVHSHSLLGLAGIAIVALSSLAGIGFASYCGVLLNGVSINLAPFVSLGLGIDDMFVLMHAMSSTCLSSESPANNLAATLRFAGPSVLLTSVANSVAFFLVVIVPIAGIRQLVLLLAINVIMNLLLLFLLFVPCMLVDLKRVAARRMDLVFVRVEVEEKKSAEADGENQYSAVDHLIKDYYGPFLSNPVVKVVIIVFFVVAFVLLTISGITWTEEGLRTSDIALRDTYQRDTATIIENIIPVQKTSLITISKDMPFSSVTAQKQLLDIYQAVDNSPWIAPGMLVSGLSWFGNGSSSMRSQYAADGPQTLSRQGLHCPPIKNGTIPDERCFEAYFYEWEQNIGVAFIPYLYCLNKYNGSRVSCTSRNATVTVARTSAYVGNLTTHQRHLDCIRDLRRRIDPHSNNNVQSFAIGYMFYFWEQYFNISSTLLKVIGFGLLGVFAVTFLFQLNPWLSVIICAVVFMIDMELYGLSRPMGIKLNGVSVANLCVSIGLAVEFTAHVARAFLLAPGTRNERMVMALREMVVPMINGAMSTILAVVVLVGAKFPFFRTYYSLMFVVVVLIACVNGLVFLPVVLSIIGPPQRKLVEEEVSSSPPGSPPSPDRMDSTIPLDDLNDIKKGGTA